MGDIMLSKETADVVLRTLDGRLLLAEDHDAKDVDADDDATYGQDLSYDSHFVL